MIDLSFLTEEEQEAIMKVLQRDAELKRTEEERVRHLPEKVKDHVQLKNMSGQWFYEAKSKRHRDKIHGADIIRASMRRKPATIAEVGQNKTSKAKISWVNNVNKEGFVPPDLHGIVEHQEEEQQKASLSSKEASPVLNKPEERPVKAAVSSVRQRRNPFNSTTSDDNLNNGESEDRPAIVPQLSKKEIWSVSEDSPPKSNLQNDESDKPEKFFVELTDPSQKELVNRPVPKARKLIHKAADSVSQREDLALKPAKQTERINGIGTPPRGILKRSSSSSSTDSEVRVSQMLDVQKKNDLSTTTILEGEGEKNSVGEEAEDSTQNSLEKLKQVRFSSSSGKGKPLQSPQPCHVKEKGDHDILKPDKKKNSGNYAVQSDSLGDRQIPAAKPLGTYLSTLQMKTIDGLQEDTSASSPRDSNRSVFPVSESFQTNTVTPKKLETPQKTSSNILSNSNNEQSVNETREKKSNQILSHESESHKNFTDRHQLLAETEAREVSNTNSTSLQQGKPDLVEERDAKTIFKPGKHADELVKVDDESVSKVLDWFKRSSSTEDEELSMKSQGREPREEVDVSIKRVLPTEHSGPGMHGTTKDTEERPFGKIKQQSSISPTSFTSKNIQLINERVKPKTEEANKKQNDKLLTEFGCTRVEEKEHGQEIKQQNQKSNLLEHQGHKLPAQKCESEKAIQEKRRIREIRAFWERDKTIPSHREKGVSINTDASGGHALTGLRESDKLKQSAAYLPKALHDQCKNTLRSPEVSCASQASRNKSHHSFESGPGHTFGKAEGTLQFDEVCECTELPKASNLHPRTGVTSVSSKNKDKDEKETLKGKVAASSQQKPNFQVLSLKEKMNEKSKNQISDPSHFQSLRNFWDTGVKFQSSIDREDDSLPNNTRSIIYERKSKEDKKGRDNVSKQELIKQQTQTPEREKTQKLDSVVCKKSLGSPVLRGLNVTHTKNTDSLQPDRQPVISKSQEKMGLPEHEVRECTEKSIVSSKDNHVSLQLQLPGDKDALKETVVGDKLYLPIEKGENKTTPLDKEEVAETVDKVVLPKGSEEELNPVLMALKRSADRKKPSKSLEDIPSATSNKEKINKPKEELVLSDEDGLKPDQHQERTETAAGISTVTSQPDKLFSNPEKLKGLSKSVPSFLQEESDDRETDTASESSYSFGRIKKSPSSLTNLSSSSGMASLSSVSGSLMSIYSADFGNVDVKGNIQFAIDYVEQLNELHIFICQCKELAVADIKRQRSDPYVKTYLLPEKYRLGKRKTSVKKKTFNPVYNEILRYKIEKELLKNQSLNISVWHNDTFGRNSFLGEVELDLGTWDWNDPSNKQINWFPLKPRTSAITLNLENRGEMKLALQYVPHPIGGKKTLSTGEVHIWVKECHNLPLLRGNRLNSFIKCTILPDTSRKSRQKTRTVAKTTNPVFNHTMVYDGFRPEDLKEACIELTVWDHNKLANHFLGGLRIGLGTGKSYGTTVDWMDSTSDETALWEKMMNSPNTWIEDTLPLRMLMVAKLTK
ncbi:synaptotagmin-like protein 2 isoform X2 [Poecile atricapillus]|uniref:synaptotagmin-like protein 2 isoform X2 n=1 Tax=Poecile atricapillus TaxID=48891 RepID=UPI002738299F|nr:synaptotagmin-like protein 2 isoform X2 [Poecile atricapillus]